MHARRCVALRACSRRPARRGVERPRFSLRLGLSFLFRTDGSPGAIGRILRRGRSRLCESHSGPEAESDHRSAHDVTFNSAINSQRFRFPLRNVAPSCSNVVLNGRCVNLRLVPAPLQTRDAVELARAPRVDSCQCNERDRRVSARSRLHSSGPSIRSGPRQPLS